MDIKFDYSQVRFQENGRLKLLIIVGTRPEIIRLAAVINKCRSYFDCLLAHTGQNYDYNLNGVFFRDLKLKDPDVYMDAVGDDLGATMGNIINASYKLMVQVKPDAVLVLGDTNSCLSVIGAKRLHIPIFHMEAGNRCFDELSKQILFFKQFHHFTGCMPGSTGRPEQPGHMFIFFQYLLTTLLIREKACKFYLYIFNRHSICH